MIERFYGCAHANERACDDAGLFVKLIPLAAPVQLWLGATQAGRFTLVTLLSGGEQGYFGRASSVDKAFPGLVTQ